MEDGEFIKIDYIGRIKESGEIFDVTDEKIAKENKVYNPRTKYGSVPVIIGNNMILLALENEIKKMKVGEKKTIELEAKDAFGERDIRLIKIISESQFKNQDMTPLPGLNVELNGIRGRILSVNAGRVKVDFNHPLSGKGLIYEVEIKELLEKPEDKIASIFQYYTATNPKSVVVKEEAATVELAPKTQFPAEAREKIAAEVKKWTNIKKVKFEEVFE